MFYCSLRVRVLFAERWQNWSAPLGCLLLRDEFGPEETLPLLFPAERRNCHKEASFHNLDEDTILLSRKKMETEGSFQTDLIEMNPFFFLKILK